MAGTITNNLWAVGAVQPGNLALAYPSVSSFADNVVLYVNENVGNVLQWGVQTGQFPPNYGYGTINVSRNIFAHTTGSASNSTPVDFEGTSAGGSYGNNIVYDWFSPATVTLPSGISGTGNNYDPGALNTFDAATRPNEPFSAPTRSIGGYYASIGNPGGFPSTTAGFVSASRAQSKDNWTPGLLACAVNIYIRAGFDVATPICPTYP